MVVNGRLHDQITTVGNKKTARNPTDRGKQGVKRSLLTNANGLPLSLVVAAANTHDIKLVADTLDALQTGRPGQKTETLSGQRLRCRLAENLPTEPPLRAVYPVPKRRV